MIELRPGITEDRTAMLTRAITREPNENLAEGLTTLQLGTPSFELAKRQHKQYVRALESLDLIVTVLDPLPGYPDAHFVEDTAVITPEIAVITNPGAASRRGEADAIEPVLAKDRETVRVSAPGTLDGGDVLMTGRHFLIGLSQRTNKEGAFQLGRTLEQYGYTWAPVPVLEGLHLKSNVSCIAENTLLVDGKVAGLHELRQYDKIIVDEREKSAASTLLINEWLMIPSGFPRTRRKLDALGLNIIELDISEMRKMDGGLTCMSLRF